MNNLNKHELDIICASLKRTANEYLDKNDIDAYDAVNKVYKKLRGLDKEVR